MIKQGPDEFIRVGILWATCDPAQRCAALAARPVTRPMRIGINVAPNNVQEVSEHLYLLL